MKSSLCLLIALAALPCFADQQLTFVPSGHGQQIASYRAIPADTVAVSVGGAGIGSAPMDSGVLNTEIRQSGHGQSTLNYRAVR